MTGIDKFDETIETSIRGNIEEVFTFWFHPSQSLPPLKRFIRVDFREKGKFQSIFYVLGGKREIFVDGIFIKIDKNKKILFSWNNCLTQISFEKQENKKTRLFVEIKMMNIRAINKIYGLEIKNISHFFSSSFECKKFIEIYLTFVKLYFEKKFKRQ